MRMIRAAPRVNRVNSPVEPFDTARARRALDQPVDVVTQALLVDRGLGVQGTCWA